MMKQLSRLILSLLFLGSLCGSPSSLLGQKETGDTEDTASEDTASIAPLLPRRMNPSYKSVAFPQLNETSITPSGDDEYHYARCWRKVNGVKVFQNPCTVYFYSGVRQRTGGHVHDNPERPGETMSKYVPFPRDGSSSDDIYPLLVRDPKFRMKGTYTIIHNPKRGFRFKVEASVVAQEEGLTACNGFPLSSLSNCEAHTLRVKYRHAPGLNLENFRSTLKKNDGNPNDTMVASGSKEKHPQNHYGLRTFNETLKKIAEQYYNEFACQVDDEDGNYLGYQPIAVNDMSLAFGGLLDIDNDWSTPHKAPGHAKGLAADIRYRDPKKYPDSKNNSIIYKPVVRQRFEQICEAHGITFILHEKKKQRGEHIHIEIR